MTESTDCIERSIVINAPLARVWRAVSNAEEFGDWFGVALKGKTFAAGQRVQGQITHPGYEHLVFDVLVERIEPPRYISWRWRDTTGPRGDDPNGPTMLVEFKLEEVEGGTRLTVTESGLDALPPERRLTVFRENSEGWDIQMQNVARHVTTP